MVEGVKIATRIENHVSTVEDGPRVIQNPFHEKNYSYVDTKERDFLGPYKIFYTETKYS